MKKACPHMDPKFRTLSAKASRARVAQLRRQGYVVREVDVPGVGTVVTKRKRAGSESDGGAVLAVGAFVLACLLFARSKPVAIAVPREVVP